MAASVPEKPTIDGLEAKWGSRWEADGTYRFDRSATRDRVYAIDTPPPTVSGSLHIGHVFSYTHTDTIARYRRMRGYEVWYPIGWDDNGLATERRVQNYFGVRCDPSLPYQAGFVPPVEGGLGKGERAVGVSRPNFVELCERLTAVDEKIFEDLWRHVGLSVDWSLLYTTMGAAARRASQRGFLRLLQRGQAYSAEAPTLWDVDFKTAVAQAELEDRELAGAYYRLAFHRPDGTDVLIDTTRPELLPACVALVAHPDDERYRSLLGTSVTTPLFGVSVPVVAHPLAQPDKGTGVAMICTFGDLTDVIWWRELHLPVRSIVGRDGRLLPAAPSGPGAMPAAGAAVYEAELAGKTVKAAQARIVELLADAGELVGDSRPITHPVKFYEKGDRPLEIVTSRQWFIATLAHRSALAARGQQLRWHPTYMGARFASWVEGLNADWLISRQRFFGVPFPVWYSISPAGDADFDHPLLPDESRLPVDPSTEAPDGFLESERGQPGGFMADPDVMDTWATSSLTPQLAAGWEDDPDLYSRVFPMDLRPQAHDIIRTWLFSTVVRSHLEFDCLPWSDAAISGWILDPDRKKMSKSKGNVVTPQDLLDRHGSDAVRYWAASGRPGTDTALDEGQMKVGRKLAIKLLNASKFVLANVAPDADPAESAPGLPGSTGPDSGSTGPASGSTGPDSGSSGPGSVGEELDRSLRAGLARTVTEATDAYESYDYARALERTEAFFWAFCDDYVELVKSRAYGTLGDNRAASARTALRQTLSVLLRLLAPVLPFVTEEIWSWWHDSSIHREPWPAVTELGPVDGSEEVWQVASDLLGEIRRAKTEAGRSLRAAVASLTVTDTEERLAWMRAAADDVAQAGTVTELHWQVVDAATPAGVTVVLAPD